MAKFDGFDGQHKTDVEKIYKASRKALEAAAKDLGSGQFRQRFRTWMGTGGLDEVKSSEKNLAGSVRVMFMRAATLSFTVKYDAALGNSTNADMWGYTGSDLTPQDVLDKVDSYRSGQGSGFSPLNHTDDAGVQRVIGGAMVMRLGPNIWGMPFSSLTAQSQVETFIHELSHHAAGTIDDKNGGECYGMTGVNRLKGLGPARAVRNAENVGVFCTTYV